jgi:transcriptional regulator with XRE-family HTH domain
VGGGGPQRALAAKLKDLIDGTGKSFKTIAQEISAQGPPTISATYLWKLCKGLSTNPTLEHLEALARYFHVDPGYFFADESAPQETMTAAEQIAADPRLRALLKQAGIERLALRAADLSPGRLRMLERIAEDVAKLREETEADDQRR